MMLMVKDPDTRIDFGIDWAVICPDGQAVVASRWTATPVEAGGVAIAGSAHDLMQATVTLAGGIAGHVYRVTNRVTMGDGQIDERSIVVRVEER